VSSILVVDDEAAMRHLVTRWVENAGHSASTAASAEEALRILSRQPPAIALCDVRMPGRDGIWLAERIRRDFPDTAVIMATAARDTDPRVAEHTGAVDYLVKPFGRDRLKFALERGFDWHQAAAERRVWLKHLTTEMNERREQLRASAVALQASVADTLDALLELIGADDPQLLAHSRRTAAMALRIGDTIGLTSQQMETLKEGALLHDFGKLGLPTTILRKPATLTSDEKAIVRRHPDVAAEILLSIGGFDKAAEILRASTERYDGRSCDKTVPGEAIRLCGRIVAVADAYDSMTHHQIYRDALPNSDATREILRCSSTQFDPDVVSVLLEVLGEIASVH
jgi:response regulator RpfG family c-di-GMP phosphodiesterase